MALRGGEDFVLFNGNGDANADGDVVLWDVSAGSASTLVTTGGLASLKRACESSRANFRAAGAISSQ